MHASDKPGTPYIMQDRIQRLGGQILQRNGMRVMGALAMCRAIGDHALRPYGEYIPLAAAPARLMQQLAHGCCCRSASVGCDMY